jgi:hypothetical protein
MSETEKLLNDIRAYLRISAAAASKTVAKTVLNTYEKALVYSKLDGKTSQAKIEADTKVPQKTVSNWVAEFAQAGLVAPFDKYNPSNKALFTLQELGIELDGLGKRPMKASKPSTQATSAPSPLAPAENQQGAVQKTLEPEGTGTPNK